MEFSQNLLAGTVVEGLLKRAASRLNALVRDLLTDTRIRGEQLEGIVPTNLKEVLDTVLLSLGDAMAEANATIRCEGYPTLPINAVHLQQILQNLILNALRYRSEDPPVVTIDTRQTNEEWVVRVSDSGIGIDPSDYEKLFKPFSRLHGADKHIGTGLGLALCHRVIERYGGCVWVEPAAVGQGSTFCFTIPVRSGSDPRFPTFVPESQGLLTWISSQ